MTVKKITLSAIVLLVAYGAFRLSFDAQLILAIACGVDEAIASHYPLVVDAGIVAGVLVRLWAPNLSTSYGRYVWGAVAFWTLTSILGNAIHILALPAGVITVPFGVAIALNTVPAVTLFLVIHITTEAFKAKPEQAPVAKRSTRESTAPSAAPKAVTPRTDVPTVTDEELLAMADDKMTMQQIAAAVGRSKSWVGAKVKDAREAREKAQAAA